MITKIKSKIYSLFNDEKFKEILHGSIYSFSAKILASMLGIVTSIIGARYYGAEMIGLVAIIGTVLGIAGLFAVFGMSTSLLRLVPEYESKYSINESIALYKRVLVLVLLNATIVGVIVFMLSDVIANSVFHIPELTLFITIASAVIVFQAINSINVTMIRALKKNKTYAFIELLPKVISLVLLLFLTYLFYDKYNLIYIVFAVIIILALMVSVYLIWYFRNYNKNTPLNVLPSKKYIIALSLPMFLTSGLQTVIGQTDIIMIGIYRSAAELGVYSIVFALAMITNFVLSSINVMAAPKFSELYHAGKVDELKHIIRKSSKLMFWGTLPILLALLFFGKLILSIYGDKFIIGHTALVFLILGQFINSASGSNGFLMNMCGYQKEFRNIMLVSAIINVVLNYILISGWGINGAAFASLVSVAFWNIVSVLFIQNKFGFSTFYLPFLSRVM